RCRDGTDRFFNGLENPKLFPPSSHYPHTNTIIQLPSWANDGFIARGERPLHGGFFRKGAHQSGSAERKEMIDHSHKLPVTRQCRTLKLLRSSVYYLPRPVLPADLALMRRIDKLHLDYPFAGARMLRDLLRREGHLVGRRHVSTLMKRMGIGAIYRKPNTSRRHPSHQVYPYLLRNLKIERPNHVWAADITYIPMKRGFVYLFVVMDWASRRVLSWRLSNTLS